VPTIQLSERGRGPDGSFVVRVAFDDGVEYEVTVVDPAGSDVERELVWYFEEHLQFPFLDQDRRRAAVELLRAYGEALFSQVFGGAAGEQYRTHRQRGFDDCRLEVVGSSAFHRLHWEALRDPKLDTPLAVRLPVSRRVELRPVSFAVAEPQETLNILVVTARPDGPRDVGYRTISRPLLDALRQASLPVTVDLVRPGTWEALRGHLRQATDRHGSGWYHLVHFDMHGAFRDFDSMRAGQRAGRLLFAADRLEPYEGRRGFLFFETVQEGKPQPESAAAVAGLLAEHRVPMAVLNACQSAMQTDSEAALAQQLVEAGVPVVVGMSYSVTVSAAALAMPVLYEQLAQGVDPDRALRTMRRSLFDEQRRDAYFDQQLELQDWVLPVVFRQRSLQLRLRSMTEDEADRFYGRQDTIGEEPSPEYGFVGRDLDIQAIERRLLVSRRTNQVLVRGMAGAGKSTLIAHLSWWWQRTGLVERVFAFNYADRAWTAGQIIRQIAERLLSRVELARVESLSEPAQRERVAELLRSTRHLLVIDNAESITASPAAIPHALDSAEQDLLRRFLSRLRGGRTLVVLGSRESESWLARGTFEDNAYDLPGLDPQAASVLVERILARHHATHHHNDPDQRKALQELITLLGGYPLPLEVVLPVLATTTPRAVLAELNTGGSGADPVGLIRRAIEYSHGKLDPTIQHSLLLLAPFVGSIPMGPALDLYQQILATHSAVQALGPIDVQAGLRAAVDIGLAAGHPTLQGWAITVPVLPYFLRSRLQHQPDLTTATSAAHHHLFAELGAALHQMVLSHEPEQRATGRVAIQATYANLTAALDHALHQRKPVLPLIGPLEEYLDQSRQQPARRHLLEASIVQLADHDDAAARRELAVLCQLAGIVAREQRRFEEAENHYKQALALKLEFNDRHSAAGTYHNLGVVAQEQRRFEEAESYYKQALALFLEFNDRHSAAGTYHQLGVVAREQRRFEEAESYYKQALALFLEFNDRHSAASTYHQLGVVAQDQRRFEEAENHYKQALALFLEFNDRHSAARTYHSLGVVAQDQRRFEEAESYYKQALALKLEFNDRHSAAGTYHQLGVVAREQRRFEEAESYYKQALALFLEFNDRHSAASTYHQLGVVAQEQRRFEEAENHYKQAFTISSQLDRHRASQTATRLGSLLSAMDRHDEAIETLVYAAVTLASTDRTVRCRRRSSPQARAGNRWGRRIRAAVSSHGAQGSHRGTHHRDGRFRECPMNTPLIGKIVNCGSRHARAPDAAVEDVGVFERRDLSGSYAA
jgi:tetratricopeptide (TPR) repeat protein